MITYIAFHHELSPVFKRSMRRFTLFFFLAFLWHILVPAFQFFLHVLAFVHNFPSLALFGTSVVYSSLGWMLYYHPSPGAHVFQGLLLPVAHDLDQEMVILPLAFWKWDCTFLAC